MVMAEEWQQHNYNQQYSEHPQYSDRTRFTHKITNKTNSITTPNSEYGGGSRYTEIQHMAARQLSLSPTGIYTLQGI
jgi:hypothetical protein